jgi:uncharacterized protein YqeY
MRLALVLNALAPPRRSSSARSPDEESLQVLQRERKKRVEAIEAFDAPARRSRPTEEFELDVIEEFMPDRSPRRSSRRSSTT